MSSGDGTGISSGAHPRSGSYSGHTLAPGSRIRGYEVEQFIASGGFGSVYRIRDASGHPAALKILHPELRAFGDSFVRFLREAHVLELISHPNVVAIYDSGTLSDGRAFMIMEFLSGHDLEELIELDGPLDAERAITALESICDALTYAHANGVIHRDIKASNVFFTDGSEGTPAASSRSVQHDTSLNSPLERRSGAPGRIVLLDFGLAKVIEDGGIDLTSSRMALGTPASMSPEQIRGEEVDARSDVYALGGLVYHMLTGKLPFDDKSRTVMQYMHLHGQRPRVSSRANVSPAIDEVIARAMATDPRDRYPSAAEFLAALRQACAAAPSRSAFPAPVGQTGTAGAHWAVGIYVEVRVAPDQDDEDALLAAMDEILDQAEDQLIGCGFETQLEGSSATLFVRIVSPDETASIHERQGAAQALFELHSALTEQGYRGLHVNLCMHLAAVELDDGSTYSGDLMHIDRWVPQAELSGVIGTLDAFAGLEMAVEPIADQPDLVRLVAPDIAEISGSTDETAEASDAPAGGQSQSRSPAGRVLTQLSDALPPARSPVGEVVHHIGKVLDRTSVGQPLSQSDRQELEAAMRAAQQIVEIAASLPSDPAVASDSSTTRRTISMLALIENALLLSDAETRRKARLIVRHGGDYRVIAWPGRITHVLVATLVNAARTIADDSQVDMELYRGENRTVCLDIRHPGMTIGDQVDPGLSWAREIIEEHGGTIAVITTPGRGSNLIIELPAAANDAG